MPDGMHSGFVASAKMPASPTAKTRNNRWCLDLNLFGHQDNVKKLGVGGVVRLRKGSPLNLENYRKSLAADLSIPKQD